MGPDLTNEYSLRGGPFIRNVLINGFGNMPRIPMSNQDADALVEYLKYVDSTGQFPQKKPWPLEALPN
ncbi:hypothetical protein D3C72_2283510 [compost metagenome]